jgi:hypothetical protein
MLLLAAALLTMPTAGAVPPRTAGVCTWVHGRFDVWNGSSVRRIWIVGTHRLIARRDADAGVPEPVRRYVFEGPHTKAEGLFGDFHVCALEASRPGHMQHIRLMAARNLRFRGRAFPERSGE